MPSRPSRGRTTNRGGNNSFSSAACSATQPWGQPAEQKRRLHGYPGAVLSLRRPAIQRPAKARAAGHQATMTMGDAVATAATAANSTSCLQEVVGVLDTVAPGFANVAVPPTIFTAAVAPTMAEAPPHARDDRARKRDIRGARPGAGDDDSRRISFSEATRRRLRHAGGPPVPTIRRPSPRGKRTSPAKVSSAQPPPAQGEPCNGKLVATQVTPRNASIAPHMAATPTTSAGEQCRDHPSTDRSRSAKPLPSESFSRRVECGTTP